MSKLVIISGATATGKSDLAVAIAKELTAETISADSMQLYKGMDIGTAKLTMEERSGIPHHFLDVVDVKDDVTVSWYQELARAKIDELRSQNTNVVVVGGTGLYIKAILDDLNFPETDPDVREKLNLEAEKIGGDAMHERLAKLDPAAGLAIPKENVRRVVRALEVIEITENLNFCRGNAVKYLCRAGLKDPEKELEDLKKARWYVDREISRLEKK
jgi:tRNA dimethylallyltransferase